MKFKDRKQYSKRQRGIKDHGASGKAQEIDVSGICPQRAYSLGFRWEVSIVVLKALV